MHIPKTGGTSIDAANMYQSIPAFDSLMRETYQRIAVASNLTHANLGKLYVDSHKSWEVYSGWLLTNGDFYRMIPPNGPDSCEDLHTPPSRSPLIAEYYRECETFCAIRNPLERFWSAFRVSVAAKQGFTCDPEQIEKKVLEILQENIESPYISNCFWTPQVEFVYGTRNWSAATQPYCTRIVHQENLTAEFDELMSEIGRSDVKLPDEELMSSWSGCDNMTTSDLTPLTRKAIYDFYKEDFDAFGYKPPQD
eukprot:Skav223804  [mRNA]  locus=scaffold575:640654:641409:- [translate_table: standard]